MSRSRGRTEGSQPAAGHSTKRMLGSGFRCFMSGGICIFDGHLHGVVCGSGPANGLSTERMDESRLVFVSEVGTRSLAKL